jgi:hypothetical protein
MSKAKQIFSVMIQGWGDEEDQFYNCGNYSSLAKAQAGLEAMLDEWAADGNDRDAVVFEIDQQTVA